MAIIVDESSRTVIQGITGRVGQIFAERMARYYGNFVGGVKPGNGGSMAYGKPIFNYVDQAVEQLGANASIVVVPAPYVKDAVIEAFDANIKTVWVYTDGVPIHDSLAMVQYAKLKGGRLIGPNSAGVVSPGKASLSELSEDQIPLIPGNIGVVSKSGSLSYEVICLIAEMGYGFSSVICIGGDPVVGTSCSEMLNEFVNDDETKAIVLVGEIGGTDEIDRVDIIQKTNKPVIAYISGHSAPTKKKMGHAGAIIHGNQDTAQAKSKILLDAGALVVERIENIPQMLAVSKIRK